MPLLFKAYPYLRPFLFLLEAEKAHHLTLEGLQQAYRCGLLKKPEQAAASATLMGLPIRNRVGLAAGLDKNGRYIDALSTMGFGFIEVGTVTPRPQPGNPRPRLFRLPAAEGIINRFGFNNEGLEQFVENIRHSQFQRRGGILGLNIGKNADTPIERAVDDYVLGLKAVYAHADYITINISSPNTQNLRALQEGDELRQLLKALTECRQALADEKGKRVPLAVKIAPDLTDEHIQGIAQLVLEFGIDGVIATNTTLSRSSVEHLTYGQEAGGLSGTPVRALSTSVIRRLRAQLGTEVALIGVGGILSGEDAAEKIAAGADAVQLYSGLIYRGAALVDEAIKHTQHV
ncbi:MAG: quinone-dependent dihydroorotate dehydrogenase [Pigmentiphaga sp.]|nr:quinone-dependent dihydroorotate dehydrogenase [Pigmentiphaga sp.]